jgi:hypothetical protein
MPDGTARLPRIILSVPLGLFDAAVRRSILRDKFNVPPPGSSPLDCVAYYRFVAQQQSATEYPDLNAYVEDAKRHAQTGDPTAQLVYGMLLVGMPQLHANTMEGLTWFVKAAQAGLASRSSRSGTACSKRWTATRTIRRP